MHELSIAISLIEVANAEMEQQGVTRVAALHLRLGPLSGVVRYALEFSYEVAASGTPLEGSRLVIEEVPVIVFCSSCQQQRQVDDVQYLCCPACGGLTPEVVQGRELQLFALELEESTTAAAPHANVPAQAAGL